MRILWIPQISCMSSDRKVLLNKDSNITFLRKLLSTQMFKRNEVDVCFEFNMKHEDLDNDFWKNFDGVVFRNTKREFAGAFNERFDFDSSRFMEIKNNNEKYDIIFVNEPSKVLPLKNIFKESKVVTYIHWLAADNMKFLEYRQREGIENADLCFVNSNFVIYKMKKLGYNTNNVRVFYPTANEEIMDLKVDVGMNIIYNHRLSSDGYYKSAYNNLVRVMDMLEDDLGLENMPTVYFTNPSGKDFDVEKDKPYFKKVELSDTETYVNFLKSKEVGIHLNTFFDSEGMWCSSTTDCACYGVKCLLPKKFGYAEIFSDDYYGYCHNVEEMYVKLRSTILSGSKIGFETMKKDMEKLKADTIADCVEKELENILK